MLLSRLYRLGIVLPKHRENLKMVRRVMRHIDEEMKLGNIHDFYYQLIELNVSYLVMYRELLMTQD